MRSFYHSQCRIDTLTNQDHFLDIDFKSLSRLCYVRSINSNLAIFSRLCPFSLFLFFFLILSPVRLICRVSEARACHREDIWEMELRSMKGSHE